MAAELRPLSSVGRVITISDFVPANQSEKLSIIEDLALFYEPVSEGGGSQRASAAEQTEALRHLLDELQRLERSAAGAETRAVAGQLAASLGRYLDQPSARDIASLAKLEASLLQSLPEQLRVLDAALGAGEVRLENLPDALLSQMLTADGRARVQIFPTHDLSNHASLATFYDEVREAVPLQDVSGSAAEMVESGRTVVAALRQALLSALVAVTLVMLVLWRRLTDTALVLVPLALASTLTVAAAVLFDIPFNFADVIVLPLLLGIGVDSGIHLVHRARMSGETLSLLGTSTARAVGYSALTTIASFGTMGFATHLGLATLGRLLTLGVIFTLLCNLVVLPSLIRLRQGAATEPGLAARVNR
jgi:hypothetical protein